MPDSELLSTVNLTLTVSCSHKFCTPPPIYLFLFPVPTLVHSIWFTEKASWKGWFFTGFQQIILFAYLEGRVGERDAGGRVWWIRQARTQQSGWTPSVSRLSNCPSHLGQRHLQWTPLKGNQSGILTLTATVISLQNRHPQAPASAIHSPS